jgi:L-aminopeptidase/D-esterase-like protein
VPIVPAAVLFDLGVGDPSAHPDAASGRHACVDAEPGSPCGTGPFGAGTGATVGKLRGPDQAWAAGVGTASLRLPGGGTVGAVVAVNAIGDVVADSGEILAGVGAVDLVLGGDAEHPPPATSTTLAVVATDVALTKAQAHRLAVVTHDGFAQAIRPVHTMYDGDVVFTLSTGTADEEPLVLQVAAVDVVARAIRGVVTAEG